MIIKNECTRASIHQVCCIWQAKVRARQGFRNLLTLLSHPLEARIDMFLRQNNFIRTPKFKIIEIKNKVKTVQLQTSGYQMKIFHTLY